MFLLSCALFSAFLFILILESIDLDKSRVKYIQMEVINWLSKWYFVYVKNHGFCYMCGVNHMGYSIFCHHFSIFLQKRESCRVQVELYLNFSANSCGFKAKLCPYFFSSSCEDLVSMKICVFNWKRDLCVAASWSKEDHPQLQQDGWSTAGIWGKRWRALFSLNYPFIVCVCVCMRACMRVCVR